MKKFFGFIVFLMPVIALADAAPTENKFNLNVRRIGFDWSNTSISNAKEYQDSTVAALKASDQENLKGVFDVALEYGFEKFRWDNSVFMEYGKQTLKPYNEEKTVDESADKILLSSDLAYAWLDLGAFKFGPIARLQYETEFVGDPRRKIIRPNAGFSLFDNAIIKSLYITGAYEYDFTYSDAKVNKSLIEAGWRIEYEIREGVKFASDGYYRNYLSFSEYVGEDLRHDFMANARFDTNLWGDFTFGPYVQYRRAHSRQAERAGANTTVGVSFSYMHNFDLMRSRTEKSE